MSVRKYGDSRVRSKDYLYDLLVHDLTGPLSVVAATTDALLEPGRYGALTGPQRGCLERIARNTRKVQRIVREILDVARAEEHLFIGEAFSVQALAREALANVVGMMETAPGGSEAQGGPETWDDLFRHKGVTIDVSGPYAESPFFHDRRKIQLILENLMSNGLKYRTARMGVAVTGETDLVLTVTDDGPGIPKGEQEAVYRRFSRLDLAGYGRMQGLGLGLFCVKALVEAMGGGIEMRSGEGRGTSFVVKVPPLQAY
jgi:signal transduction histidine kinase